MSAAPTQDRTQEELRAEARRNGKNGCVGRELVLENARVRIWKTSLKPGERMAYHAHLLDFVWIAVSDCHLIAHDAEGATEVITIEKGAALYQRIARRSKLLRALCNRGEEAAEFTVIEFLESENKALPIPLHVRKR